MNRYIVVYFNYVVNETQYFCVMAKNKFRAGRIFHRKYGRRVSIEKIIGVDDCNYYTEEDKERLTWN